MNAADILLTLTAIAAICIAIGVGPLRLTVRAVLRRFMPPTAIRRWQEPVTIGFGAGFILAIALAGFADGKAAITVAVIGLLLLMAILDLAWRWLPFAWTVPLITVAIAGAIAGNTVPEAALGLAMGAGILWGLQLFFRYLRGIDALGTGDIWLAAGLGALTGPQQISLILGLAAITGLLAETARQIIPAKQARTRLGVAYGAHMALAYFIFFPF